MPLVVLTRPIAMFIAEATVIVSTHRVDLEKSSAGSARRSEHV